MSEDLSMRPVPAPAKDWLSSSEVRRHLGNISEKALYRLIVAKKFPHPTSWGRDRMWQWEDVAWYYLGKRIESRLEKPVVDPVSDKGKTAEEEEEEEDEDEDAPLPAVRKPR